LPSNINDATYFELRLIEETCTATKIPFKFPDDLSRYTKLLKASHGDVAQEKIDIQEARLKNGIPTFLQRISEVENKLKEKLTEVDWVGRKDLGSRVADIDLIFGQNRVLPISAKSGGPGTERNLGGDSLKGLLGYDSSNTIEKMKEETLKSLNSSFPNIEFGKSWGKIRKSIKSSSHSKEMTTLANLVGKKFQTLISIEIIEAWRKASDRQKMAFVAYLSLQNDTRDHGLEIFVAEDKSAYFKKILNISELQSIDLILESHSSSSNGTLELLIRNTRFWRININFTNGIGLSPIAIRAFLI
jgi:hypothetical protein